MNKQETLQFFLKNTIQLGGNIYQCKRCKINLTFGDGIECKPCGFNFLFESQYAILYTQNYLIEWYFDREVCEIDNVVINTLLPFDISLSRLEKLFPFS